MDAMSDDPWSIDALDLEGYLSRTGVEARPPSIEALDELCRAHTLTFSFDNLDILLDQHPGVGLPQVAEKFIGRGRGGYCFEHTTLFAAVLERLGYDVDRRLGRVGGPDHARTHMVAVVRLSSPDRVGSPIRLGSPDRIVDVGIGRPPQASIPLVSGAEITAAGWDYRVVPGDTREPSWAEERATDEGWQLMHVFDELPVRPVDVELGHHWTSTHPTSHFTTGLVFGRYLPDEHVGVAIEGDGFAVTSRRPDTPTERRMVGPDAGVALLQGLGNLSDDEAARLATVAGQTSASLRP